MFEIFRRIPAKILPNGYISLSPNRWLPSKLIWASAVFLIFASLQGTMLILPMLTSKFGFEAPWLNGWRAGMWQTLFLLLLLITTILMASSLRRISLLLDKVSVELIGLAIIILVLTSAASDASNTLRKATEGKAKLDGLNLWISCWYVCTIFGLKPVLDHLLDKAHPRVLDHNAMANLIPDTSEDEVMGSKLE